MLKQIYIKTSSFALQFLNEYKEFVKIIVHKVVELSAVVNPWWNADLSNIDKHEFCITKQTQYVHSNWQYSLKKTTVPRSPNTVGFGATKLVFLCFEILGGRWNLKCQLIE